MDNSSRKEKQIWRKLQRSYKCIQFYMSTNKILTEWAPKQKNFFETHKEMQNKIMSHSMQSLKNTPMVYEYSC